MDDGSAPPRVEIELTEDTRRQPRRSRMRGRSPGPVVEPLPPAGDGVAAPTVEERDPGREKNRLLVTALAVGAVALFLGWVLGRAGGEDSDAAQTVGATTTTMDEPASATTAATGDTLPAVELPTTTRPRRTTTTTLPPEWQVSTVQIDPRLAGQTDRIVAVTDVSGLVEVDLATGELRTLPPARGFSPPRVPPLAGADWIMIPSGTDSANLVYRGDATTPDILSVGNTGSALMWAYDSDRFWAVEFGATGEIAGVAEFGIDGQPTGRSIDTRGLWPGAADPAGGVLVGDVGLGSFSATPDGSTRLPDGRLIAISARYLVVYACAENLDSCGVGVVDRETGETRAVPAAPGVPDLINLFRGWLPERPPINVDGTAVLITMLSNDGVQSVGSLDLVTGAFTVLGDSTLTDYGVPSAVWSADGRFAFTAMDENIRAYDRTTGEIFDVVTAGVLDPIRSLTVRPPVA